MCEEQNAKDIKVKEDDRDPLKEGVRKLGDTIQLLINAIKPIADIMQMAFKTLGVYFFCICFFYHRCLNWFTFFCAFCFCSSGTAFFTTFFTVFCCHSIFLLFLVPLPLPALCMPEQFFSVILGQELFCALFGGAVFLF